MGTFTNSEDSDEMRHFIRVYTVCWGKKDFPFTDPFYRYGSVEKLFYFTSQIRYPLNLIVNSPTLGNSIKYTNNLQLRILFTLDNSLSLQIANEFKKK